SGEGGWKRENRKPLSFLLAFNTQAGGFANQPSCGRAPMDLIDTHAHLDADAFAADLNEVLARAKSAGLSRIFTIGITLETSRRAVELAEAHPEVSAVVGIQPNYAAEAGPGDMAEIEALLTHPKVVGIGETGLDRYWDFAPLDKQTEYFRQHLELAFQYQLP